MDKSATKWSWIRIYFFIVIIISYFSDPSFAHSSTETYRYDALGRLVSVQNADHKATYAFDQANNRSSVEVQKQFETSWSAASLPHSTGYAEYAGWGADIMQSPGYMTYGPYTNLVPVGARTATWRLMVDNSSYPDPQAVAVLDVNDATTGEVIASRSLSWRSFSVNWSYQVFELPFFIDSSRAGHILEIRTFYTARGHINVDRIGYY